MRANTRLTVRLNASDKHILSCAAALTGTSTGAFIRAAAKEALAVLKGQAHVSLTQSDFAAFTAAISNPFTPNPALKAAQVAVKQVKIHS